MGRIFGIFENVMIMAILQASHCITIDTKKMFSNLDLVTCFITATVKFNHWYTAHCYCY